MEYIYILCYSISILYLKLSGLTLFIFISYVILLQNIIYHIYVNYIYIYIYMCVSLYDQSIYGVLSESHRGSQEAKSPFRFWENDENPWENCWIHMVSINVDMRLMVWNMSHWSRWFRELMNSDILWPLRMYIQDMDVCMYNLYIYIHVICIMVVTVKKKYIYITTDGEETRWPLVD